MILYRYLLFSTKPTYIIDRYFTLIFYIIFFIKWLIRSSFISLKVICSSSLIPDIKKAGYPASQIFGNQINKNEFVIGSYIQ